MKRPLSQYAQRQMDEEFLEISYFMYRDWLTGTSIYDLEYLYNILRGYYPNDYVYQSRIWKCIIFWANIAENNE